MARGNNGQKIFPGEVDYRTFVEMLVKLRGRHAFRIYAFCLMPNHIHLLAEVANVPTGQIMQGLLTAYARTFNRRHGHRGHVFEGRYKAIVCDKESYLLELTRYIHLNPVRARLVKRPEDWPWSGHRSYLGMGHHRLIDAGPVMGILQNSTRYAAFMREGRGVDYVPEWHPGEDSPYLGDDSFVRRVSAPLRDRTAGKRQSLDALCRSVARRGRLSAEALKRGGRSAGIVAQRDRFILRAVAEEGYRASEVARFLGCHASNITRAIQKPRDNEVRQV
jgi:REP element-mobilizing transposase RayT